MTESRNPRPAADDRDDFLSLDELQARQDAKLAALGRRLAHSPQWQAHFAAAGASPLDLKDRASLAALPLLEKSHLRNLYPYPLLTVPLEQVVRFCATSGTTGLPVLFGFTLKDWEHTLVRQLARIYRTVGVRPGDRVYQGYGYGLWVGGSSMDEALKAYGAVNFPVGPGRGELMVQWLKDHRHTVTTMSPLWLMTLIQQARKAGIDPRRDWALRLGIFGGQSVSATFRNEMEALMPEGFMAHNIYGTTEAGGPVLGISCPHSHGEDEMHLVNDDSVLTEVLEPQTLRPVAPGEVGEIVITTLDKEASPVLRWRTRDLVRRSAHPYRCACGRHAFARIGRIIGRSDDMLKVRGVLVYPSQIEDVIAGVEGLAKDAWQIYIDNERSGLDHMEVAIERVAGSACASDDLAREVRSRLKARLGLSCEVRCHEDGTLPRYEAKATRVLRRSKETLNPTP
ncbi:phenylacetate--CoA ligase family protein [Variovorax sp. RA8]|uniref:phenylacetate--CoA ligase family protein n=1 Tax=Variovorax sp. (strain JCM 16519 / RA8) TaxID=662548 RepID=UPI001317E85F|nr:AMP-binding protein [Variovorax sp. RA8]VTU41852.1 Phenylacetate-coenzyme A ligase [Variovorax sp. RA8]